MANWKVEATDEFDEWTATISRSAMVDVDAHIDLLEEHGPLLGFPYSSSVHESKYGQMRELRVQHRGSPIRILYAFDPRRHAILLIGGDKKGNKRWYVQNVPLADKLFSKHLKNLEKKSRL